MKLRMKTLLCALLLTISWEAVAQTPIYQTIRGTVLDKDTRIPLIGANVVLLGSEPLLGATTDFDGYFRLPEVPIGRVNIQISYLGYESTTLNNILLTSGKELVLNIELQEATEKLEEVVVRAKLDKTRAINEMATVSARSFSVEETSRYASSLFDPARMAQNYAGVSAGASDDLFNEIIIRGNSPRGVHWRLEGIEIPNPNHFSALGNSGGAISMLSSSTLANSDFYTGAFPSEYGNALSGVFDLKMRNGNNEQQEYAFMIGALGVEASAEGPLGKNSRASYLINYRYSTLALLEAAGLNPAGDVLPKYQDLSFKINLPTESAGTFALFGLGGKNTASFVPVSNVEEWEVDDDRYGFVERQTVGTVGLSHRLLLSEKSYLRTVLSASVEQYDAEEYYLDPLNDYNEITDEKLPFRNYTYRLSTTYNHKFDARNSLRAGLVGSLMDYNFRYLEQIGESGDFHTTFEGEGNSNLLQAFVHWKHRLNDVITFNSGAHFTRFGLNGDIAVEPRLAMQWKLNNRQSISTAVGLHSRPEHISFYFVKEIDSQGNITQPNKDLDMTRAMHAVIAFDQRLGNNMRLKAELYYQHLYKVPVENRPGSTNSILNAADIWEILDSEGGINEGKGRNYGLDLTLEKFFSNQYYFMLTGSLYRSRYTALNGIEYSTRYDGGYQVNILGGREFKLGKDKNKIFGVNGKMIFSGGNRYTPVDLEKSIAAGTQIRKEDQPFTVKAGNYYRFDLGLSYKINRKRMTHTIMIDIQNLTSRLNPFGNYFDEDTLTIETYTQTGLFPTFNYRIEF